MLTLQEEQQLSIVGQMQSSIQTDMQGQLADVAELDIMKEASSLLPTPGPRKASFLDNYRNQLGNSTIELNPKENMGLQIRKSLDNIYVNVLGDKLLERTLTLKK